MIEYENQRYIEQRLKTALANNDAIALKALIHDGIDANTFINDMNGNTSLLIRACISGHLDCVKALLECGANTDLKHGKRYDALYYAVNYHWYDITKLLIESGACLHDNYYINNQGTITLLIKLISQTQLDNINSFISLFIMHGINIDSQGSRGDTALITAVKYSKPHATNLLLDYNANLNITNHLNHSAFDYSRDGFLEHILAEREAKKLKQLVDENNINNVGLLHF